MSLTLADLTANLVLACSECNDVRRDTPWEEFLKSTCVRGEYRVRREQILAWVEARGGSTLQRNEKLLAIAAPYVEAAQRAFDEAVAGVRRARTGCLRPPAGRKQRSHGSASHL